MLDQNILPFGRQIEITDKGLNRIIREITLTPVEPGLLKLMNPQVQTSISAMVKKNQGNNVYLLPVKS